MNPTILSGLKKLILAAVLFTTAATFSSATGVSGSASRTPIVVPPSPGDGGSSNRTPIVNPPSGPGSDTQN